MEDLGATTFRNSRAGPGWMSGPGTFVGPIPGAKRDPTRRSQTQMVASLEGRQEAI